MMQTSLAASAASVAACCLAHDHLSSLSFPNFPKRTESDTLVFSSYFVGLKLLFFLPECVPK